MINRYERQEKPQDVQQKFLPDGRLAPEVTSIPYTGLEGVIPGSTESQPLSTQFINYSGKPFQEIFHYFPHELRAQKVVIMPDFSQGRSPLPTGTSVEIDPIKQPNWRRFAISDVGCGMRVLKPAEPITWEDFEANRDKWDHVYTKLRENATRRKNQPGDLGSGNHFLDAVVDDEGFVYFVIHTGSRDESPKAEGLVNKWGIVEDPQKFDRIYRETTAWARKNRRAIANVVKEVYGQDMRTILDRTHNFYGRKNDLPDSGVVTGDVPKSDGHIVIYKGTVRLVPGKLSVIPSSMDGDMVLVRGNDEKLEPLNWTMAHGTGRVKSRSESRRTGARDYDFAALRRRIYIPDAIEDSAMLTEDPSCYRDLDAGLTLVQDLVNVEKRLHPIAYIGQIEQEERNTSL